MTNTIFSRKIEFANTKLTKNLKSSLNGFSLQTFFKTIHFKEHVACCISSNKRPRLLIQFRRFRVQRLLEGATKKRETLISE